MEVSLNDLYSSIDIVCSSTADPKIRYNAELSLRQFQLDPSSWKIFLNLLRTANGNTLFFVAQGLILAVWRQWNHFSSEVKNYFMENVIDVLKRREDIDLVGKSKVEQVLCCICVNSARIFPILNMLDDSSENRSLGGLSSLKTLLETVLLDDPKVFPEDRISMRKELTSALPTLTNIIYGHCTSCLNSNSNNGAKILQISFELLNMIISKMEVR